MDRAAARSIEPGSVRVAKAGENSDGDELFFYGVDKSTLGSVLVAAGAGGVVAILIGDEPVALVHELHRRFPQAMLTHHQPAVVQFLKGIIDRIERPTGDLNIDLDVRGTAFQKAVWEALREVPPGQTTTFTEIARKLGTSAVRAVGHACSNNPLAIAIPCHRVLRKDGSLSGGTRWGNERQKILLEREDSRKSRTSASRQR